MSTSREMGRGTTDEAGNVYGRLTVLQYAGLNKHSAAVWLCQCDCGAKKTVRGADLRTGATRSCGCLHREMAGTLKRKRPGVAGFNQLYRSYKWHAEERDYEFGLTEEDFSFLTRMNCYYCGAEPAQESWASKGCVEAYIYNGIDRLDNGKGYLLDNVVPCCGKCNVAKHDMPISDFLGLVARIHERRIHVNQP